MKNDTALREDRKRWNERIARERTFTPRELGFLIGGRRAKRNYIKQLEKKAREDTGLDSGFREI